MGRYLKFVRPAALEVRDPDAIAIHVTTAYTCRPQTSLRLPRLPVPPATGNQLVTNLQIVRGSILLSRTRVAHR